MRDKSHRYYFTSETVIMTDSLRFKNDTSNIVTGV